MSRDGGMGGKKGKTRTMKAMDPQSLTTKRRANRKKSFVSLEQSSRIHRRASRRLNFARFQYGRLGEPGEKMQASSDSQSFVHKAGGSIKYY